MCKKLIALFFAVLMILSVLSFSACGDKDNSANDGDKTTQTDDENKTDNSAYTTEGEIKVTLSDATLDIPEDARYDGYTFTVFAPYPGGPGRFVVEALNDTPINDAIYNRNLAVSDRLGVTINSIDFNTYTDAQAQKIIDSVLAGDHSFDCAAVHSTSACAALIIADAVLSFDNLEYCDLSKPWWIQSFNEQCSILDRDYFGISSACYSYYNGAASILFNKTLAKENNLPDLYELVRKGEWTIDKMIEITKNFSQDLNSDGIYDSDDLVAVVSDDHAYLNFWYGAFRQSTVEKGENDEPVYLANSNRMSIIVDKLNTLFNTGRRGIIYSMNLRTVGDTTYNDAFAEGRILFFIASAGTATGLRDYDVDFGIIPLPKFDSNQETYGSWVDPWHLTLCVPIDNEDPERTSIILETMAYYSYKLLYPAVIEQSLFGSGTRDVESLEMLEEYILPNVYFDFGYIYDSWGTGYSSLIRSLVPFGSTDIASYVAERKNTVESHYSELYDAVLSREG